jgi:uncharacterized protein (TIGR02996 family)
MRSSAHLLLDAICAQPDDLPSRLVYADWLAEGGDPLGEFVVLDCTLADLAPFHPDRPRLAARRGELFDEHLRAWWLDAYRRDVVFPRFRAGFVEAVHVHGAAGELDFEELDDHFDELLARWLEREPRRHAYVPLWLPDDRAPLVRRFGGLPLWDAERYVSQLIERDAIEVRVVGDQPHANATRMWRALGTVRSTRTFLAYACAEPRGFEEVLALPALVELGLERSPKLVECVAAAGIPASVERISVEPSNAEPLRAALRGANRPFVENRMPAPGELLLATDAGRIADLAFVDRPIVVADDAPPFLLDVDDRAALEKLANPRARLALASGTWELRDELAPGEQTSLDAHGFAVAWRAVPSRCEGRFQYPGGIEIADRGVSIAMMGPVYARIHHVTPGLPLLLVWRVDTAIFANVTVQTGAEPAFGRRPALDTRQRWRNWVSTFPAANVRESSVRIVIGSARERFDLYHAWFYQPAG